MASIWRDRAISVVLLSTGEQGLKVLDLAREWMTAGLLSPAAWVQLDNVAVAEGRPPSVKASVVGCNSDGKLIEQEIDLFELLARESLKTVRLIKLRSAEPDNESDEAQDIVAEEVAKYVAYSMPQSNPGDSGAQERTELIKASLICAPTQAQLEARARWAAADRSIVVVASPEDRATPTAGDAFVRENERFAGFVLMHLATIAGLWRGVPVGSLETFEREASAGKSIWMQRLFISAVLTGGLARRTAADILTEIVGREGVVEATGTQIVPRNTAVIPVNKTSNYIGQMVRATLSLDDRALAFHEPDFEGHPNRYRISISEQLKLFWSFSSEKISRIPHWTRLWTHDLFARQLGRNLQGESGMREVEVFLDQHPDAYDRRLLETIRRVREDAARTESLATRAPQAALRQVTPRLWAGLRQVIFSSLDGSSAPEGHGFTPIDGHVPVFGSLAHVAPSPKDQWQHPGPVIPQKFKKPINWVLVRQNPGLRQKLAEIAAMSEQERDQHNEKRVALAQRLEQLQTEHENRTNELIETGLLVFRANGSIAPARAKAKKQQPADGAKSKVKVDPSVSAPETTDIEKWRDEANRCSAVELSITAHDKRATELHENAQYDADILESFDEWIAQNSETFAVRVFDSMAEEAERAQSALELAQKSTIDVPDVGELTRLRKLFHRRFLTALLIITAIAAFVITLPSIASSPLGKFNQPLSDEVVEAALNDEYPDWWWIALVALVTLLIVTQLLLVSYYRIWSTFERKLLVVAHDFETRHARLGLLSSELKRLKSTHEQATAWINTLISAIYRPWEVPGEWLTPATTGLDTSRLPFAMHIAQAVEGTGTGADRLKRNAAEKLIKQGWRADAFEDLVNEIGSRLGLDQERFGIETLDHDLPEAPNHARERLQKNIGKPDVLEALASSRLRAVTDDLQRELLYGEGTKVKPLANDPLAAFRSGEDDGTLTWIEHLSQTILDGSISPTPLSSLGVAPHQVQQAHHEAVTTYVLAPQSVASNLEPVRFDALNVRIIDAQPEDSLDVVIRMDIVGPIPVDAIRNLDFMIVTDEFSDESLSAERTGI